jgi:hypothetical protein
MAAPLPALRVLLISLEFADPIFSGNGVYSRTCIPKTPYFHPSLWPVNVCGLIQTFSCSIARSLLREGFEVTVLSGIPSTHTQCPAGVDGLQGLFTVPCDIWKRLDRSTTGRP